MVEASVAILASGTWNLNVVGIDDVVARFDLAVEILRGLKASAAGHENREYDASCTVSPGPLTHA